MGNNDLLYRYISFESFVNMIQKQALTFVLPETWDDPTDKKAFDNVMNLIDDNYYRILLDITKQMTYCQCWTTLYQSDAMWRIYSHQNRSVRIKANEYDLLSLNEELLIKTVKYTDKPLAIPKRKSETNLGEDVARLMLDSLSRKRTAFRHEKEARLILPFSFSKSNYTLQEYLIAYTCCYGRPDQVDYLCKELDYSIDINNKDEIKEILNIGGSKKASIDLSFAGKDLIKGVLVNPFAPDWYVKTVEAFCNNNNIQFEGKSVLY